jgi:Flp pilus assembly protein TadD
MRRRLWPLMLIVSIPILAHLGAGHLVRAAEDGTPAELDPQTKQAIEHFREGLSAAKVGAYDEAIRWYESSLSLKPHAAAVNISLGYAFEKTGRLAEAERAYREAIRLRPAVPHTHVNLGNVLESSGKPAEAEQAYLEALRLKPKLVRALNNLAWLWVSSSNPAFRRPNEALAHAKEAVQLTDRMEAGPLDTLAEVRYVLGQCFDAIQIEREAIVEDPDNGAFRSSLRRFQLCQNATRAARDGNFAKARRHWKEVLAIAPDDWRAQEVLEELP